MEEKRQPDLLSQLLPDALEEALGMENHPSGAEGENDLLLQRLRMLAGQSGGPLQSALQDFLDGKGELNVTAQAAATRGSGVTEGTLADLLADKFGLAPALAKIFASLLVKLFPATRKTAKKPRRKPKTTTRPKAETSSARKKPKKKAAAKPKKPAKKPAKSTAKSSAKKPSAKRKTRSTAEIPLE